MSINQNRQNSLASWSSHSSSGWEVAWEEWGQKINNTRKPWSRLYLSFPGPVMHISVSIPLYLFFLLSIWKASFAILKDQGQIAPPL